MCDDIVCSGDARLKLSWGVGSGGDKRLDWILNWYLRSMLLAELTPEMIALMEVGGYDNDEDVDGSVGE